MSCIELIVPHDTSYHLLKSLSSRSLIHLIDLPHHSSPTPDRPHLDDYAHCEEAQRSLQFLGSKLKLHNLLHPRDSISEFESHSLPTTYRELLPLIEEHDSSLRYRLTSTQQLSERLRHLTLARSALAFYRPLLTDQFPSSDSESNSLDLDLIVDRPFIHSITGVIAPDKMGHMVLTAYRLSRGNIFLSRSEPSNDSLYFTIWYQTSVLGPKLSQVCVSYGATIFEFPIDEPALDARDAELALEIEEVAGVLEQSYRDNHNFLIELADRYWDWWYFFVRETIIYKHMDYADFARVPNRAIYRGWVPDRLLGEFPELLLEATSFAGSAERITFQKVHTKDEPPTWIETNEFTAPFQLLNDSYGFANYDEVNGGAFYSMYPFLFGIMFGDIGHSFLFLLASLVMVLMAQRLEWTGMAKTVLEFRYFILIMACCGIYNGLIYNECFGLPINFFGSHWRQDGHKWAKTDSKVYPIGVDPIWQFKDNELIFLNSMKMKISVVIGVIQMLFGLALQLIKQIHRHDWIQLCFGWVPQLMYLGSFFSYMVVVIIIKWTQDQSHIADGVNLIQTLINIVLRPGKVAQNQTLYAGQSAVQIGILAVFVGSIPIMLIVKPIVEGCMHGTQNGWLELFVISLIEVMEFALSALSHTASYLRLWALSLAHSQLARVLYEQLFVMTTNKRNPAFMFVGFVGWAGGTIGIICGMECFSSLLHGIRLMWVEFSSKFYTGMGYEFEPLSFKRVVDRIFEDE